MECSNNDNLFYDEIKISLTKGESEACKIALANARETVRMQQSIADMFKNIDYNSYLGTEGDSGDDYVDFEDFEQECLEKPGAVGNLYDDMVENFIDKFGDKSNSIMPILLHQTLIFSNIPAKNAMLFYTTVAGLAQAAIGSSIAYKAKVPHYEYIRPMLKLEEKLRNELFAHCEEPPACPGCGFCKRKEDED